MQRFRPLWSQMNATNAKAHPSRRKCCKTCVMHISREPVMFVDSDSLVEIRYQTLQHSLTKETAP